MGWTQFAVLVHFGDSDAWQVSGPGRVCRSVALHGTYADLRGAGTLLLSDLRPAPRRPLPNQTECSWLLRRAALTVFRRLFVAGLRIASAAWVLETLPRAASQVPKKLGK